MSGASEDLILEKISHLHTCVDAVEKSVTELKRGLYARVEEVEKKTAIHDFNLKVMNGVAWLVLASSLTVSITTLWKVILK